MWIQNIQEQNAILQVARCRFVGDRVQNGLSQGNESYQEDPTPQLLKFEMQLQYNSNNSL